MNAMPCLVITASYLIIAENVDLKLYKNWHLKIHNYT